MVLQYMGQTLIQVVAGSLLLALFVTGKHAQTVQIGSIVKQRQEDMVSVGARNLSVVTPQDGTVDFHYEEQCFLVGEPVRLESYFKAKRRDGTKIPVEIEEIFPQSYEKKDGEIIFKKDGIYEVRVSAEGMIYEVCVPVVAYPE